MTDALECYGTHLQPGASRFSQVAHWPVEMPLQHWVVPGRLS
jgi:hypothetical protein